MRKILNWLLGTQAAPPSAEDEAKRVSEIIQTMNELEDINKELKQAKEELNFLNKLINSK